MWKRHISERLAAHIDGELDAREAARVERHVAACAKCRAEREAVEFGMEAMGRIAVVEPPDALWVAVEAELRESEGHLLQAGRPIDNRPQVANLPYKGVIAWAAAAVLLVLGIVYWAGPRGRWIETGAHSSARVAIGKIGWVEVEPNTRVRVVADRATEHRLALARGEIRAKISAPPRLFFVDTASGTAVDLGCEYSLKTDENGLGLLQVTKGWVSFEWNGLESLVPAGASCRTRPRIGPGIPYFDDAPESLKQGLETSNLDAVLGAARVRDTLTLWHLLSRVGIADRARVYDRIAALTPVPAGVLREQALRLDAETLRRWKQELAWTW